jgi:hypothetical protein
MGLACHDVLGVRARFHGRLELDMRVQPALQHALLEYRLCRDWRDWRPNWISFSTQPISCLQGNKVTAFLFCLPFCPRFAPVQAPHGNALLGCVSMGQEHGAVPALQLEAGVCAPISISLSSGPTQNTFPQSGLLSLLLPCLIYK